MARTKASPSHMYVYGDSTAFEPGFDFVTSLRALVTCGVSLMRAQHAIDCARARVAEAGEHAGRTRADLATMGDAVERALVDSTPRRTDARDIALRIATMARGTLTLEIRRAQSALEGIVVRADATIVEARKAAGAALAELLSRHELPGLRRGFRLFASDGRYGAEAIVALPCGLRVTFDATLPETHALAAPLRVRTLQPDLTVSLPRRGGWLRKRSEIAPVELGGMTVLGASMDGSRGALLLGKNARAGIAHVLDVDVSPTTPRVQWRDGDDGDAHDLAAGDAVAVASLLREIERLARSSPMNLQGLSEALLDGRPLGEHDPSVACARLVGLAAPVAVEMARRSGAVGELVLRRNIGAGHRDEVFVTTAELQEQIETLAPSLRRAFAPLGLQGLPRSRRAPARSLLSYEELSGAELVSVA